MGSCSGVELDCSVSNMINNFDLSGLSTAAYRDRFTFDAHLEPAWIFGPPKCYSNSMNNVVFPELQSQHLFETEGKSASLQPSYPVPMFAAFNHLLNSNIGAGCLPFTSQTKGSMFFPANRTLEDSMISTEQRCPSFPAACNGTSAMFCHKEGNFSDCMVPTMTPQEIMEAKALAASKSHSEAERRRRSRINTHLATLRSLLPSATKTDKASLLAEVIRQVKELKRQAAEVSDVDPVPSDLDELSAEIDPTSVAHGLVIRVSMCCDDRPGLLSDLSQAIRNLDLQSMKTEISTLGERMKLTMLLKQIKSASETEPENSLLSCVKEAFRTVINRSHSAGTPPSSVGGKRQKAGCNNNTLISF